MTAVASNATETDPIEHYFGQPWSDGLPVVVPTPEKVAAIVDVLGGDPE